MFWKEERKKKQQKKKHAETSKSLIYESLLMDCRVAQFEI